MDLRKCFEFRASGASPPSRTGKLFRTIPANPADTYWKELPVARASAIRLTAAGSKDQGAVIAPVNHQ